MFGYGGKQVRDNIHSADLVEAFLPSTPPAGRRPSTTSAAAATRNCSMLEAIDACERIAGRELAWELSDQARIGDHRWWISDVAEFQRDYPGWELSTTSRPPARDPRRQRRALERGADVKLSVVIPARNEAGSIEQTVHGVEALEREGIEHEIVVIDDASTDGTAEAVAELAAATSASTASARTTARASASRSAPASIASAATRSRS